MFQTQTRYTNAPFGSPDARFDYTKQPKNYEAPKDDLIVVDQEVKERRMAFQKTAELHSKLAAIKPNAVFSSVVKRTTMDPKMSTKSDFGATKTTFDTMIGSTHQPPSPLKSTRQRIGQDAGYFLLESELHKPSFNSKDRRFGYKDVQLKRDLGIPAPG